MPSMEKGFTLIELLVVVSIIALLTTVVMTSVNGNRRRALDVSFQSTAKSIQQGAGICCSSGSGNIQVADMSGDICNPPCGSVWPPASNLGTVEMTHDCSYTDGYVLRIYPGTGNAGSINHAECDRDDCVYIYN